MVQPQSHPLADNAPECCADFEASDEEAGCQSDEEHLCDASEPTDTEVSCIQQVVRASSAASQIAGAAEAQKKHSSAHPVDLLAASCCSRSICR